MKKYNNLYKEIEKTNRKIAQDDEELLRLLEDTDDEDDEDDEVYENVYNNAYHTNTRTPDISPSEKPHRKAPVLEGITILAFFFSIIYTTFMLFGYKQLHLRELTIAIVSFIIVCIIERVNK